MNANQSNEHKLDTNLCDLEPVQFIGSIQSFGFLLEVDEAELKVQRASQNSMDALGREMSQILNFSLSDLFGESLVQALRSDQLSILLEKWHVAVQRKDHQIILEFEPFNPEDSATFNNFSSFDSLVRSLKAVDSTSEICKLIVEHIQKFSHFDRVMIYRFHDDLHGEVVAEATRTNVDSFLGLHYPASDIPAPARALFQKNPLRMIPDVGYVASPIISANPKQIESLDLTMCTLRGVSPVHIEYLKNMKVGASLTLSILVEDKLWGLIACHHLGPKFVTVADRKFLEFAGGFTSSLIATHERLGVAHEKVRSTTLRADLFRQITQNDDLNEALVNPSLNLTHLIDSKGVAAAIQVESQWLTVGNVPSPDQLEGLVSWLAQHRGADKTFCSNSLSTVYPPALKFKDCGSGLLAISIPKSPKSYILCFRPEWIHSVRWGGNPDKPIDSDAGDHRLHPRKSFEAWTRSIEGQSEPWKSWEIDAALELRDAILAVELHRQFVKAQKLEAGIKAREEVMSILAHDLKNPIASIRLSLDLIPRMAAANSIEKIAEMLATIRRSSDLMSHMITDILDVTRIELGSLFLVKDRVDAREVLNETIEALQLIAAEKKINIAKVIPKEECIVSCDRGRLFQVVANLLSNAIKFTPIGGNVTVGLERGSDGQFKFRIADTGPGIPKKSLAYVFDRFWQAKENRSFGSGLGLSIAHGIVVKSGGNIWVESEEGRGSTFYFTLPGFRELSTFT